jgi:predicted glycosyltransferase
MAARVRDLARWARAFAADVALSHNSYGQIVAARALGLKVVTAMDYEGQPANHLAFRLAHVVLAPEALRGSAIARQGAGRRRVRFYAGFKEELYLGDFRPDPGVVASLGLVPGESPLVVLRTPPSRAAYHRFGNPLFASVLERLGASGVPCVALVRHAEQRSAIAELGFANIVVPQRAVDSRSLMYGADLVIGAGGTMTREAALMAVPTYSVFAGEQPAVDRELERQGRLRRLRDAGELPPLRARPSEPRPLEELRDRAGKLVGAFADAATG